MRGPSVLALASVMLLPAVAGAKLNRNFLVPAYEACPGSSNCNPPTLSSSYTFDSILLYSPADPYTAPGKLALRIVVKGLRDGSGNLFNGTIHATSGQSRITILGLLGTIGETSPLAAPTQYTITVKNGAARYDYKTPPETPEHGLIANSLTSPVVYDPDGKPLAVTGARTKP